MGTTPTSPRSTPAKQSAGAPSRTLCLLCLAWCSPLDVGTVRGTGPDTFELLGEYPMSVMRGLCGLFGSKWETWGCFLSGEAPQCWGCSWFPSLNHSAWASKTQLFHFWDTEVFYLKGFGLGQSTPGCTCVFFVWVYPSSLATVHGSRLLGWFGIVCSGHRSGSVFCVAQIRGFHFNQMAVVGNHCTFCFFFLWFRPSDPFG